MKAKEESWMILKNNSMKKQKEYKKRIELTNSTKSKVNFTDSDEMSETETT
jgi:hypothetical protein